MSWWLILALAGGAYLFKAVGLLAFDARSPSPGVLRLLRLLPPALLAGLVVVQTLAVDEAIVVDARAAGVAAGAVAAWRRAPFVVVIALAAAVTAALRAVT